MHSPPRESVKLSWPWSAIAVGVAIVALIYFLFFTFDFTLPGFVLSPDWEVTAIAPCVSQDPACLENKNRLLVGDRIASIGTLTYEEYNATQDRAPFGGFENGDVIPLVVQRNTEQILIEWRIPEVGPGQRLFQFVPPFALFFPFWLAGALVTYLRGTRSPIWRLFVLLNYVVALWLGIGLVTSAGQLNSIHVFKALSWLMLPLFIHFHIIFPRRLLARSRQPLLATIYLLALVMAGAEFFGILESRYLSYVSVIISAFGSLIIIGFRSLTVRAVTEKVIMRLQTTGILLAFLPGIVLWMTPVLLDTYSPGLLTTIFTGLALATWPIFYSYAIYRQQLGAQEALAGRLVGIYVQFLVYLFVLILGYVIMFPAVRESYELVLAAIAIFLATTLTLLGLRSRIQFWAARLIYGRVYDPRVVLQMFSSRLPSALDQSALASFLADDFMPAIFIRKSAAFVMLDARPITVYSQNVDANDLAIASEQIGAFTAYGDAFLPRNGRQINAGIPSWIRLLIPLQTNGIVIGLWLFGSREPDDYYGQRDIELLQAVAKQLSTSFEIAELVATAEAELYDRRRAERLQSKYANRLEVLRRLDLAVLEARSPEEIALAAVRGVTSLIPYSNVSFILTDKGSRMTLISLNNSEQGNTIEFGSDNYTSSLVKHLRGNRIIHGYELAPEITEPIGKMMAPEDNDHYIILIPIIGAEEPLGALTVYVDDSVGFTTEFNEVATEITRSVSVALHTSKLVSELKRQSNELKNLSNQLMRAQEIERLKLSRDLHDEMGNFISAININLAHLQKDLPDTVPPEINQTIADTLELLDTVSNQIHDILIDLRPLMLQDLGLIPTVRSYSKRFSERNEIEVRIQIELPEQRFVEAIELAVFRVIQESLTNIARHASAAKVDIIIERIRDRLCVTIKDDGVGFDVRKQLADRAGEGIGLLGMRERIDSLDGMFFVKSALGKGTTVYAEVPLGERNG